MDEPRPLKIEVPNSTFDTQDQDDGSVLLLRHGVPVGRLRIEGQRWAAYMIDLEKEVKVCAYLLYNQSLYELSLKVQNFKLKEQLKKIQDEK